MLPGWRDSALAAFLAGVLVLLAFFVWHWFSIAPVWRVLAEGIVGVGLASMAVGWAWCESRRRGRFGSSWGGAAFGGVFVGGLVLLEAIGLVRGPRPDPTSLEGILLALPPVLVPVAAVAVAGGWLAGGWRGAAAYGLAGLVLLLFLGGSILQRGGVGLGLGLFLLLVPAYLVAGLVLARLAPRLARGGPP